MVLLPAAVQAAAATVSATPKKTRIIGRMARLLALGRAWRNPCGIIAMDVMEILLYFRGSRGFLHSRGPNMRSRRALLPSLLAASLLISLIGCGGTTQFAGSQAFAIAGTPPP